MQINASASMVVPQGEFILQRAPPNPHLQAWDAADEMLLNYLHDGRILAGPQQVLMLNDAFGALAVALAEQRIFSWSDSWLAQQALRDNLLANGYAAEVVDTNATLDLPPAPVDCVLIKIPKSLALLEYQLYALRALLHHDTRIVAAGMARHIHSSTLELFETILGPASTTRAVKKSRLVLVERDHSLNQGQSQHPTSFELQVDRNYRIVNHASVFSRDRLDPGSRLLLEQMPVGEQFRRIVDLGCGNGVLGLIAAAMNPAASLLFYDESYMAIASAEANFRAAFAGTRQAEFRVGDCLQGVEANSHDLVLINPPFHQQHSIGDAVAWKMFMEARRVLVEGGELRIVGNRHLGYHAKLKKLFGNCTTVAANKKFVVLSATK
jgi:16S rRNA (guanine1207-N2)-methyltransferase